MTTDFYLKTGKLLFVIAVTGLGIVQLASGQMIPNFTLPGWMPLKAEIAYLTGLLLVVAGIFIIIKKYSLLGAGLAAGVFAVFLVFLLIPKLIMNLHDSGGYTFTSETFMLLSGALLLCGNVLTENGKTPLGAWIAMTGKYIFSLTLFDFGMEHWLSEPYVVSIIPAWIPWKVFWAYFVMCAFFAASVSLFFNIKAKLSMQLVCLMFFLFIALMHIPDLTRAPGNAVLWSFFFVPVGVCGIAMLTCGWVQQENKAKMGG